MKSKDLEARLKALSPAERARLAQKLNKPPGAKSSVPIAVVDRSQPLPTSFAQARLWFLDQLDPGSATYNFPLVLRLEGILDVAALERALGEAVARHDALRTTFVAIDGEPHQVVHPSIHLDLTCVDVDSDEAARALVSREAHTPFDLTSGPVFRTTLLRLRDDAHVLVLCMHHIATDGWSTAILTRELSALYTAFHEGRPSPLSPLLCGYADFSVWQRARLTGDVLACQIKFWSEHLEGAPAALDLPTDRPRPVTKQHHGDQVAVVVPRELAARVQALCIREGATPFIVLLTAYQAVLSRWSGQSEIVVGTPIANRTHRELEDIIGFFVNTLTFRTSFAGAPSFLDVVRRVKDAALAAHDHQDIPFEKLVDELRVPRDASRTPIFQALFSMQNVPSASLAFGHVVVTPERAPFEVSKFDLTLLLHGAADDLRGVLQYDVALFDRATIERFATHFLVFLDAATRWPDQPVATIPVMTEAERNRVLVEWNTTQLALRLDRTAHELFEAEVVRCPTATAVVMGDESVSYGALNRRANRLAHHLRTLGVGIGARVALYVPRSVETLVGMLGILKAGAAYVPLDPAYPKARIAFMVEDSRPSAIVTDGSLVDSLPPDAGGTVVCLDRDLELIDTQPDTDPRLAVDPRHGCYVIYTSGSTGQPKGVVMPHRPLVNLIEWQHEGSRVTRGGRTLQFTPISFDVSFQEIFSTWHGGGTLVVIDEESRRDPGELLRVLDGQRVERLFLPFVALKGLALAAVSAGTFPRALRCVVTAGEQLQISSEIASFMEGLGEGALLHNHYGPSEAHVVSAYTLDGPPATWPRLPPIGRPIANTQLYILDMELAPVPIGITGELYIGGACVADGYFDRPQLTAARFVPDPFSASPGARLYRTGDQARYLADGNIEWLGRADAQVKIRGYRVELGEIESALAACEGVREAVVIASDDACGEKRLVAYVVRGGAGGADAGELRMALSKTLPDHMVPNAFVTLDRLPVTASGKVDRKALPAPDFSAAAAEYVAPTNLVEQAIAQIWQDVLGVPRAGIHDDFFTLGGHSLGALRVVARLRDALGVEVPVREVFAAPTLAALARATSARLESSSSTIAHTFDIGERSRLVATGARRAPLVAPQRGSYKIDQDAPTNRFIRQIWSAWLDGPLDARALEQALAALRARHGILRTRFFEADGELWQETLDDVPYAVLERVDLASAPEPEDAQQEFHRRFAMRRFDLAGGEVMQAALVALSPTRHRLTLSLHRIVCDDVSRAVLIDELARLWRALTTDAEAKADNVLAPVPIQYVEFADYLARHARSEVGQRQRAYWQARLADTPPLELPVDFPRAPVETRRDEKAGFVAFPIGMIAAAIPHEVRAVVEEIARRERASLLSALLAAMASHLTRLSGQQDLAICSALVYRHLPGLERAIGLFGNPLVMRISAARSPTFRELVARTHEVVTGAYENGECDVLGLASLRLFRLSFNYLYSEPSADPIALSLPPGLVATNAPLPGPNAKIAYDLVLFVHSHGRGVALTLAYNSELFHEAGATAFLNGYVEQVAALCRDPDAQL